MIKGDYGGEDPQDPYGQNYNDLVNQEVLAQGDTGAGSAPPNIGGPSGPITDWQNDPRVAAPPGSTPPSGMHWDPTMANYVADPQQAPPSAPPPNQPPPPSPTTTFTPPSVAPPSFGGPGGQATPPQLASSGIPQDLLGILQSLKDGISNFQIPPINYQPQTTPAYDDLVRNAIMDAIRTGQQPVDATDPQIAPLLAAVQGQGQRAKEQNQGQLAERLSAKHLLSSGAYDTGVERYNQGIDEATGGTLAQMMTSVLSQRQQKLMQAIQMGSNYLNADQARQLQAELASVNSALAQYQAKSSVGLGTLASLLQNQQFYDALGNQIGQFASSQNSNAGNF